MPYELEWSDAARVDRERISAYYRRTITTALVHLLQEPTIETRNRKRLTEAVEDLPFPLWELRVQPHRILYEVEEGRTVRILRVILKGSRTTAEALRRGTKR